MSGVTATKAAVPGDYPYDVAAKKAGRATALSAKPSPTDSGRWSYSSSSP